MKRILIQYLWIALVVGMIFLTYGCGQVPLADRVIEQHNAKQQMDDQKDQSSGIPNFQGMADALGCVFAPQSCQK